VTSKEQGKMMNYECWVKPCIFDFQALEALPGVLMISAWLQFSELCCG